MNKKRSVFFIFLFFSLIFFYFSFLNSDESKEKEKSGKIATIYPKQYSDRQITENAKIADARFKNFAILDKGNLISNAINSFLKTDEVLTDGSLEHGTWLWTPTLLITPSYADEIISGAKKNNINVIYISIDSYLDIFVMPEGVEKENKKKEFGDILRSFIKKANQNGIKVDAEAGWQNWASRDHLYKPGVILDFVIDWNKNNEEKFRGFQYDVEVYLLPEYEENKEEVLKDFLNLISQTVTKLQGTGLEFSVVIPEFYDGTYDNVPDFSYKWRRGNVLEHLLRILERRKGSSVIVMSYRNYSQGPDGTIEISQDEINLSKERSSKIVIAQETGDFPPPKITFYGKTKERFNREMAFIYDAFEKEETFGGTAVHYINSFLELK